MLSKSKLNKLLLAEMIIGFEEQAKSSMLSNKSLMLSSKNLRLKNRSLSLKNKRLKLLPSSWLD